MKPFHPNLFPYYSLLIWTLEHVEFGTVGSCQILNEESNKLVRILLPLRVGIEQLIWTVSSRSINYSRRSSI